MNIPVRGVHISLRLAWHFRTLQKGIQVAEVRHLRLSTTMAAKIVGIGPHRHHSLTQIASSAVQGRRTAMAVAVL